MIIITDTDTGTQVRMDGTKQELDNVLLASELVGPGDDQYQTCDEFYNANNIDISWIIQTTPLKTAKDIVNDWI